MNVLHFHFLNADTKIQLNCSIIKSVYLIIKNKYIYSLYILDFINIFTFLFISLFNKYYIFVYILHSHLLKR